MPNLSQFYPTNIGLETLVYKTGNQTISGIKNFILRPTVNGIGVLLSGEAAQVDLSSTVRITGDQTISGVKNFNTRPTFNNTGLLTSGDLIGLELSISGLIDLSSTVRVTGDQTISGIKRFTTRPNVNGTGILLSGEINNITLSFFGDRPIRRIPVINTNYGGNTISGFLENMFFPYLQVTLSLNNFSTKRYGIDTIGGDIFIGNINSTTDIITGISYRNNISGLFGPVSRTTDGNYTSNVAIPFNTTFIASTNEIFITRIHGTRSGSNFTADSNAVRLRFEPPYYWGVSTNPNLTDPTLLNRVDPTNTPNFYSYSFQNRPGSITHTFTPVGQYIYLFYPSFARDNIIDWGTVTEIRDMNTNLTYTLNTFQTGQLNLNLTTQSNMRYRVYRSLDLISPVDPLNPANYQFRFTLGG